MYLCTKLVHEKKNLILRAQLNLPIDGLRTMKKMLSAIVCHCPPLSAVNSWHLFDRSRSKNRVFSDFRQPYPYKALITR